MPPVKVYCRFYEELNEYLPAHRRKVEFVHEFDGMLTLMDLMEVLGVPSGEIDLILVNRESVDLTYRLQDNDRVSVYPVFESMDISSLSRIRSNPLRETRFVTSRNLRSMTRHLKMLGFDVKYSIDASNEELYRISREEKRILLTDEEVPSDRSLVTHAYRISATSSMNQVREVMERFNLKPSSQ